MKYFYTRARFLALVFLSGWMTSCSLVDQADKIIAPEWEPEFAVALVNTEFNISDVLTELDSTGFIQADNNGLLSIVYDNQLASISGGSLLELPDLPVPMFDTTQRVTFPLAGIQAFYIKQGLLNYSFESAAAGSYELVVEISEAKKGGEVFRKRVPFTAPGTFAGSLDMSDYGLDLELGKMTFKYFARPVVGGAKERLNNFFFEINNLEYSQVNGYLGTQSIDLATDSINLSLFADVLDGTLRLNDPRINIHLENTYGVPIQVKANNFSVLTDQGPITLDHAGLQNGILINYPGLNEVGSSAGTDININRDNSNIDDLLAARPTGISYDLSATIHPDGDSAEIGFVLEESGFDVDFSVEIPLDIQLNEIEFEQDLSLGINNVDAVKSADLILITENGFPLELVLQAYFLDAQGQVQDSLFNGPSQLLAAAPVDANGKVNATSPSTVEIALTDERWYRLQNSSEIRVKAVIATTQNGTVPVKFFNDYGLQVKLGAKAKLNP